MTKHDHKYKLWAFIGVLGLLGVLGVAYFVTGDIRDSSLFPTESPLANDQETLARALESHDPEARSVSIPLVAPPPPSNSIELRIVDAITSLAIPGAGVELIVGTQKQVSPGSNVSLVSTDNGVVALTRDSLIDTNIVARASGYFPNSMRAAQVHEHLREGGPIVLSMARSGSLRVRITDEESGQPIQFARVSVLPGDESRNARALELPFAWPRYVGGGNVVPALISDMYVPSSTNESGEHLLDNLPTGVPLFVTADHIIPPVSAMVTIPPNSRTAELHIKATLGSRVEGVLVWDDGTPAIEVGVRTIAAFKSDTLAKQSTTDDRGRFIVTGVPRGKNIISVKSVEFDPMSFYCKDMITNLGVIRLTATSLIEGSVTWGAPRPTDAPVSSFQVGVQKKGRRVLQLRAGLDGKFKGMVAPGVYSLEFIWGDYVFKSLEIAVPGSPIHILAHEYLGTLRLRNSAPCSEQGFELRLVRSEFAFDDCPDSAIHQIRAGHGGTARVDGEDWVISPIRPGSYRTALRYSQGSSWIDLGLVEVVAGKESVIEAVASSCVGSITGRVVDAGGLPISGCKIAAAFTVSESRDQSGRRETRESDESGDFEFSGLECGEWVVFPKSLGPRGGNAVPLSIVSGQSTRIEVVSDQPGALEVSVFRGGLPFKGAEIQVRPASEPYAQANLISAQTTESGTALVPGLAPGRYAVAALVREQGFRFNQCQFLAVSGRKSTNVRFEVECNSLYLSFQDEGGWLDDLATAHFVSSSALRKGSIDPKTGLVDVCLDPGRWLAFLTRAGDQTAFHATRPDGAWFAAVSVPPITSDGPLEVALGTASIRVVLRPEAVGAKLPRGWFRGADGIQVTLAPGAFAQLVHETPSESERLFPHLPDSAHVSLRGDGAFGTQVQWLEVELDGNERRVVAWPPVP